MLKRLQLVVNRARAYIVVKVMVGRWGRGGEGGERGQEGRSIPWIFNRATEMVLGQSDWLKMLNPMVQRPLGNSSETTAH